jgi:two-component system, cell cycle sensor histidine kinase and response regulator CckA
MSGPALADRITAMKPAVRVLFMSGHSGELLSQPSSPGREFIQKPFTPRDLLDRVHAILDVPAPR